MAEAPKKGRLTLYEDLLSKETIAEMQAKDAAKQAEAAKKKKDATKPIFVPTSLGKKPNQPKPKPKPNFSAMHKTSSSTSTASVSASAAPPRTESSPDKDASSSAAQPRLTQKRGFNDWLAHEDEEDFYYDRARERGGRRNKKKKNQQEARQQTWSWDDIYDPTIPVPFQDYKRSDVEYDINDEWKRRLYDANKRELRRQGKDVRRASSSNEDGYRPTMSMNSQFAPADRMNFAPPSGLDASGHASSDPYSGGSSPGMRARRVDDLPRASFAPPPSSAGLLNPAESADDAYARRLAMSGMGSNPAQPARLPPPSFAPATASAQVPPAVQKQASAAEEEKKAKIAAQIAAMKAKVGKPATPPTVPPAQAPSVTLPGLSTPQHLVQEALQNPSISAEDAARLQSGPQRSQDGTPAPPPPPSEPAGPPGVISAAPTFNPEYLARKAQGASMEITPENVVDADEEERSSRPGQSGFAERLMKKFGWEKGQGLGASGDGITTAIIAKAEKRKKKSDAEGGGFVVPANMGKIVGGKKAKPKPGTAQNEHGTSQPDSLPEKMTEVIKLEGMLENMDVDHEIAENNLMQEIGDEMGEQYGKVERLFIWRKHAGGNDDVFVKFTSPLSAVRCMKGMDGTEFAENSVVAKFWDAEKFGNGEYA